MISTIKRLLITTFILILLPLKLTAQPFPDLFVDADLADLGTLSQSQVPSSAAVIRYRFVTIDLSLLQQEASPSENQTIGNKNQTISFNLFHDTEYEVILDQVPAAGATISYSGYIPKMNYGRVNISITDGVIAGSIRTDDSKFYRIGYLSDEVHIIIEIDERQLPPLLPPKIPANLPTLSERLPLTAGADSGVVIDVFVVYTTSAKNAAGGKPAILAIINNSVATMNTTFSNSGISKTIRLVGTIETTYSRGETNAASGFDTALDDLTGKSDGYMDNIHSLRDNYGADMVQLLFNNSASGGLAWLMTTLSANFESYAFSVSHYGFADGGAFDHEFGHNMGMTHDRANTSSTPVYPYSYGYQNPTYAWHTVMAYSCPGWCPRIDYWSNPNVSYSGSATGTSTENNARTINNVAYTVANWRQRIGTFGDVPQSHWAYAWIEALVDAGVTSGCSTGSPPNYCPGATVTRAQMAIFLERGVRGSTYSPPSATGVVFGDVSFSHWAAAWIEKLASDGITGGCGGGDYCPDSAVTRAQVAVFLLKDKHGSAYNPPAPSGVFSDVPTSHWAAAWIEQLASEGITGGCTASTYCPESPVTRDQMAIFLVRTFNL